MFESLLESILQKFLGKFIQGLNSQNLKLGVWSGKVVIENVSIKPEVLEMFEIPIALRFSSIGKLSLNVPWSSLSSSPVEVFLEKVFIIIGPKQQKDWKFIDYNTIMKKIELIENYVKQCIQKFVEKEKSLQESATGVKSADQQAGYFEKIKLRIIDNIQVNIKSIHIRFENEGVEGLHDEMKYSWGITLDKLEIYTTDINWNKNFFDRTEEKNKDKPMNKLLKLGSFCIYWNSAEKVQLSGKPANEILDSLNGLIKRENDPSKSEEILSINAAIKLVQKTKLDVFDSPEFVLDIELKAIHTNLKKAQLQEIIHLIDFFNVYHNKLNEKRKTASIISEDDRVRHRKSFLELFDKIQRTEQKNMDCLNPDDKQTYQDILTVEPIEEIFPWVKEAVIVIQKDQKLQEIEQKKIKQAQGWFGGWWGGSGDKSAEISEEEKGQLEKFFTDNFSEEALNMPSVLKPANYVWFQLEFRLEGGSITLSQISKNGDEEGVKFSFEALKAVLLQRGEKNLEFKLSVMDFNIDLLTKYKGNQNLIKSNFLKKNELIVNKNEDFLNVKFEKFPINFPENEVQPDSEITVVNKSAKIVYNPIAVKRLVDFFDVKLEHDELKDAAWQQLEKLNDATKKNLSQVMQSQTIMKLNVLLESPYIIVPFQANNDPSNECWMLKLGTLKLTTNEFLLLKSVNLEDKIYDIYDIHLQDFKMEYFSTFTALMNAYTTSNPQPVSSDASFSLIPDLSISVSLSILKSAVEGLVINKPNMTVKGSLPVVSLNLCPKVYQKLLKITDCLIIDEGKDPIEMMQTEKTALMSNAKKIGSVWRRSHGKHTWEKYYAVLSGSYIYFFANQKEIQYTKYQYIRSSKITKIDDFSTGMKYVFYIENRYSDVYMACDKEETSESWIKLLSQYQDDLTVKSEAKKKQEKEEEGKDDTNATILDPEKLKIQVDFQFEDFSLNLSDDDKKLWFCYKSNGLRVNFYQYPYNMKVAVALRFIELSDPLREYENPKLSKFLYCGNEGDNNENIGDFLSLKMNYMNRKHPKYNKIDTDLEIELGSFLINFKPDTLLKLLGFIKPKAAENNKPQSKPVPALKSTGTIEVMQTPIQVDQEIKVVNLNLLLKKVSLNMVHRKNYLSIAELNISQTRIQLQMKLQELYLEVEIGNFQLIDLTNYPKTLYQESQYKISQRRELLGIENDSQSLMNIKFQSFQPGSPKIVNKIASIAQIHISSVRVDFAMQPIFRILDYVLVQIVGVLTSPEMFDSTIKKNEAQIIDPFEGKSVERVLENINTIPMLSLDIVIKKPLICLKSSADAKDYLLIDLGVITIKNDRSGVKDRTLDFPELPEVLCDYYRIYMKDMGIKIIRDGDKVSEISKPFHFNLEVEKLCFMDDYNYCYKNLSDHLDTRLRIRSRIFPILLSLYKIDYLLLMKILFSNISYDDVMDKFHIHDYVIKAAEPLELKPKFIDENPKVQIDFQLDMENITVFIMNPVKPYDAKVPLARIAIDDLRIVFIKESTNNTKLKVYGDKLRGSYYMQERFLIEHSLLGELHEPKEHPLLKGQTITQIDEKLLKFLDSSHYTPDFIVQTINEKDPNLLVLLLMKPDGAKDINIVLNSLTVNCNAGVLLTLSGFATMDNSVTPPEPIGKALMGEIQMEPVNPQYLLIEPAKMVINVDIKNLVFVITSPHNQRPLALRGDVNVGLEMNASRSFEYLVKKAQEEKAKFLERKKKDPKSEELFNEYELNRVFSLSLKLSDIEIFICHYQAKIENFQHVLKRNILLPINLKYVMNSYLAWTSNGLFISKGKNKLELAEKMVFRISYQDTSNIQKISGYQMETMSQFQPPPAEEKVEVKKNVEVSKKLKNVFNKVHTNVKKEKNLEKATTFIKVKPEKKELHTEDVLGNAKKKGDVMKLSDTDFDLNIKGIEIVLVNDAGDAFIPVIDVLIDETHILLKKNIIMMNLFTPFSLSVSYYNPQVSRWEPIIEKGQILIELTQNAFQNPHLELKVNSRNYITSGVEEKKQEIEMNIDNTDYIPFNINVSTQMLSVLIKTMNLMGKVSKSNQMGYVQGKLTDLDPDEEKKEEEIKANKQETTQNENGDELEYVSPYSIKNETGYEIEIIRDFSNIHMTSSQTENIKKKIGKVYALQNGETMNLQIESDRDQLFSVDNHDYGAKINVNLLKTHSQYNTINGLDLSRVKTTRYLLKDKDLEVNPKKEQDPIFLISNVGLDTSSNRRLITISSQLMFRNRSLKTIVIKIIISKEKDLDLVVPPNYWLPIPLDLVKKTMKLRYENLSDWSDLYSISKLLTNNSNTSYDVKIANSYLMLTVEKEGQGFGKTVVMIDPPFLIKNCLPIDLEIQIESDLSHEKDKIEKYQRYYKLKPQEEIHEYDVPTSTKFFVKLKVAGYFWSDKSKLYSPNTEFCKEINIKDVDGFIGTINVYHLESFIGAKKFYFYLKGYILNETTYKLDFHGKEKLEKEKNGKKTIKKLLAGQGKSVENEPKNNDLIMFSEREYALEINEKDSSQWCSKELPLGTIGDTAIEFQTKSGYVHLGVNIKVLCVDDLTGLLTKVVTFTPRYIFVNMLDRKMGIRQAGTDQCFVIVEKDREPYKWHDPNKEKKILYTIITDNEPKEWEWSGEIDISAVGRVNFLLRTKSGVGLKYMKAEIRNDMGLIYIIIDEYSKGFEPYYIEQSLEPNFQFSILQGCESKHQAFTLESKNSLPFCWDYPNEKKELKLIIKDTQGLYVDFNHSISIDKIDSKVYLTIQPVDKIKNPEYNLQIVTIIENQSKKTFIKRYDKVKKIKKGGKEIELEGKDEGKKINRETEISCRISHIGINIIQNTSNTTREILYLTLRNLEFCLVDTKKTRTLQAKIRYINLDNNHSYLVNYPVLLTPTEYEKIMKKGKYFMNVYIEKSLKNEEVSNYKAVQIELEPFTIKVEDTLISVIIEFYTALADVLWPKNEEKTDDPLEKRYLYQKDKNYRPEFWFWEKDDIPISNQQTFIDDFIISPIKLNLTFLTKSKGSDITGGFAVLAMFFKALGVALANIDDAPIKLTGLKLENCFDTTSGITSKLISHYKNNLTTEVFKLLGSINLLGNPVGLFSQIGTGVQDLFEKPIEGFIKGPLEGGVGLVKGAGSLVTHTLAGTLNSLDKITGSLGTGIAALSLDDEYLAQREKMKMVKAKDVGQGLQQAGMSIFKGFEKGITGVFMKPIEGASKGGVTGFFKGTFQGLSGLIVKPVSGLLDAASKTAEGIKNTATSNDDKPRESRERLLRVFYAYDKYYMDFDKKDAELNYFLQVELKKGRFIGSTYFYGHLFEEPGNKTVMVLFVTFENFIYFNKKTLKKKWIINTNTIKKIEIKDKAINIELKYATKKKQELNEKIVIENPEIRKLIYKKLNEVLDLKDADDIKY